MLALAALVAIGFRGPSQTPTDYSATFADGTVIRVIAVEGENGSLWAPNGEALGGADLGLLKAELAMRGDFADQNGPRGHIWDWKPVVHFVVTSNASVQEVGIRGITTFIWKESPPPFRAFGFLPIRDRSLKETDLKVGVASSPFKSVARTKIERGAFKWEMGFDLEPIVKQGTGAGKDYFSVSYVAPPLVDDNLEGKVVVYFKGGSVGEVGASTSVGGDDGRIDSGVHGQANEIERIEFQIRTYTWTYIKGVRLQPQRS